MEQDKRHSVGLDPETYALAVRMTAHNRDTWPVQYVRRLIWADAESAGLAQRSTETEASAEPDAIGV